MGVNVGVGVNVGSDAYGTVGGVGAVGAGATAAALSMIHTMPMPYMPPPDHHHWDQQHHAVDKQVSDLNALCFVSAGKLK